MNNKLILTWKNPLSKRWTPVGILEYKNGKHFFQYTNGAKTKNFTPFGQMLELDSKYQSEELFPLFKNRLLSKSRPEYKHYLKWLDIDEKDYSDLLELSRSRGIRATDDLQLFPMPEKNDEGNYEVLFFSHGISHIADYYLDRLKELKQGDRLLLMRDVQNEFDPYALVLRSRNDPLEILGYCPAFFAKDFTSLLKLNKNDVTVRVQKINKNAPSQMKLLCKLTTKFPDGFKVFNDSDFEPYNN